MKISLIVPCYNEQEALPIFYRETKKVMESMDCDYEMIFVNDGSKDGTLELLKEFAKEDTHVTYIGFSRNFVFGRENSFLGTFLGKFWLKMGKGKVLDEKKELQRTLSKKNIKQVKRSMQIL